MTEVLSITNPIAPTGGTNATAPLGISASLSVSKSPQLSKILYPQIYSYPRPILVSTIQVSSTQPIGTRVATWSTTNTGLGQYVLTDPGFMPWNLIFPYFSKMTKMEYVLYYKPYKVTDAEAKLHAIWSYTDSNLAYTLTNTTNHDQEFSFDDASDVKDLAVPQFFMHNNVTSDINYTTSVATAIPVYVPRTRLNLFLANAYQPGIAQPINFNMQLFVLPFSNSNQVVAGRRSVTAGLVTRSRIFPRPYFLT